MICKRVVAACIAVVVALSQQECLAQEFKTRKVLSSGEFQWRDAGENGVEMILEYPASIGWIGFGITNSGRMTNSAVVLGLNGGANPSRSIGAHGISSYLSTGINPCSEAHPLQNLTYSSSGDKLRLSFVSTGICDIKFDLTSEQDFIFAYGSDNRFSKHSRESKVSNLWNVEVEGPNVGMIAGIAAGVVVVLGLGCFFVSRSSSASKKENQVGSRV